MKLNQEQINKFVSYIGITDIKNFIEQYPTEYQYFLQNEFITYNVPITAKITIKPNIDYYIKE